MLFFKLFLFSFFFGLLICLICDLFKDSTFRESPEYKIFDFISLLMLVLSFIFGLSFFFYTVFFL